MSFLILLMNRYFLDGYSWLIICSVYSLGLFILFMWVGLFSIISYTFWGMIWFGYLVSDLAFRWSCKLFSIFPYFYLLILFHRSFLVIFLCTELFSCVSSICKLSVTSCSPDPSGLNAQVMPPIRFNSWVNLQIKSHPVMSLLFCYIVISHIVPPCVPSQFTGLR